MIYMLLALVLGLIVGWSLKALMFASRGGAGWMGSIGMAVLAFLVSGIAFSAFAELGLGIESQQLRGILAGQVGLGFSMGLFFGVRRSGKPE